MLTNLYNYTEPLIRYKIDDLVIKSDKRENKYPFTTVESISGRQEDLLWLRNKKGKYDFIHPIVFVEFHVKGLKKIQVIKKSSENIHIKAVKTGGTNSSQLKERIIRKLNSILKNKNMDNIKFSIKLVKKIENDPHSGKYHIIKRKSD